jgi:hypothetical protein
MGVWSSWLDSFGSLFWLTTPFSSAEYGAGKAIGKAVRVQREVP